MIYEEIIPDFKSSFKKKIYDFKFFPPKWHYHKEYELLLITKGHGKRFINEGIEDFHEGDVVLIGENVPHFHLSDNIYYEDNDLYCQSDVIQFTMSIFPEHAEKMHEFSNIITMLNNSSRGINFTNKKTKEYCWKIFHEMRDMSGLKLLIRLYELLDLLSHEKKYSYSSLNTENNTYKSDTPILKTYGFLMQNFKNNITLEDISNQVGLTPNALCRHFKKNTDKTIFECLAEIRIGFATKLLRNSQYSITQIAYESGYSNISHFNHQFKEITGYSPSDYKLNNFEFNSEN